MPVGSPPPVPTPASEPGYYSDYSWWGWWITERDVPGPPMPNPTPATRAARTTREMAATTGTAGAMVAAGAPLMAVGLPLPGPGRQPNVWVEMSPALTAELQALLGDRFGNLEVNVNTSAAGTNGEFAIIDVSFVIDGQSLSNFGANFTIFADLLGFVANGANHYRIAAINSGAIVGGGIGSGMTFAVETNNTGRFVIAYVENLRRLAISLDSYIITDLIDNTPIVTMDVLPIIQDDRVLLPIRFVAEALGADVGWTASTNGGTSVVHITLGDLTSYIPIGEITPELASLGMDVPAQILNDRTMVPLRFVAEFFGAVVEWDGNTRGIEIVSTAIVSMASLSSLSDAVSGYVMAPAREEEDASGAPAEEDDGDDDLDFDIEHELDLLEESRRLSGLMSLAELRELGVLR